MVEWLESISLSSLVPQKTFYCSKSFTYDLLF